jgi:hypothetical protein
MNAPDKNLTALLRAARPEPELPPRFRQNVWRRIEDAEVPAQNESWITAFTVLLLRPRFAMATAAVLLLAGILAGMTDGRQLAQHDARQNYLAAVAPHAAR